MPASDDIDACVIGAENMTDPAKLKVPKGRCSKSSHSLKLKSVDKEMIKVRKPLGDRTNHGQKQRLKSSLASVENVDTKPIILSHDMTRGILESSQEDLDKFGELEDPKVDEDGFVIWDDAAADDEIGKDEEISKLKNALQEALEENHKVLRLLSSFLFSPW